MSRRFLARNLAPLVSIIRAKEGSLASGVWRLASGDSPALRRTTHQAPRTTL